jgi:hypothetical protein
MCGTGTPSATGPLTLGFLPAQKDSGLAGYPTFILPACCCCWACAPVTDHMLALLMDGGGAQGRRSCHNSSAKSVRKMPAEAQQAHITVTRVL